MSRGRIRHALPQTRWPTAEEAQSSLLFSPVEVGPIHLPHRTWVPAMVPWRATDGGEVTEEVLAWYGRFARGRPGAIVVEATGIRDVPSGPLLRIGHDRYVPGLKNLVTRVHEESEGQTRLLIQLIDFLAVKRRPPVDKFFSRFWRPTSAHQERLHALDSSLGALNFTESDLRIYLAQASLDVWQAVLQERELNDLRYGYRERVNDVSLPHVAELPQTLPPLFAAAARRAETAGFDGVELHYAHAYTMASFLSRLNERTDGYGGDLKGRLRLPLEVFSAVRAAVSRNLAVGCRFLADEVIDGGSRIEDAVAYGLAFAEAGFDFLSLSKGGKFEDAKQPRVGHAVYPYTGPSGHECMPTVYSDERGPLGRNLPLAHAVREALFERFGDQAPPVVGAGGIQSFEVAEAALRNQDCDVVAAARQSLADPDWFEKMRTGEGAQIRQCVLTNYCEGLDQNHKQVTCRLWDRLDVQSAALRSHDQKRRLVAPDWLK